jgi:hypothetical protein
MGSYEDTPPGLRFPRTVKDASIDFTLAMAKHSISKRQNMSDAASPTAGCTLGHKKITCAIRACRLKLLRHTHSAEILVRSRIRLW